MAAKKSQNPETAPSQTRSYPTLKKWLETPGHKTKLREILTDPVFLGFCHFIEEKNRPKLEDLTGNRPKLAEEIVRKAAVTAGIAEFRIQMKQFLEPARSASRVPEPWEHITPSNE